jgi:hypothetical protein
MQDNHGSKAPAQKAAGQGTSARSLLDEDARWRRAAELVEVMRDAGYDCELLVAQTLQ